MKINCSKTGEAETFDESMNDDQKYPSPTQGEL